MQPYFLPYIGYFQLMRSVDLFVVYDEIKYTKKGWINRNRFLLNGSDEVFTLPLAKGADSLNIAQRNLAADFDRRKLLNRLYAAYRLAPYRDAAFALVERIVLHPDNNLFRYIFNSLIAITEHLDISTELRISSTLPFDNELRGQDKVLAICKASGAAHYVNPIGGTELYSRQAFAEQGVLLHFLQAKPFEYAQFDHPFVPWLSIVDVLMFNPLETVRDRLEHGYELV